MDGSNNILYYLKLAKQIPLTIVNYLNVTAFALSWLLNSEVDFGFDFLSGMRKLGRRYDSVVTPSENTFLMSHVVLLFLGIFTVAQLLPKYRQSPLVQEGVGYWFFASSIAQLLWCVVLGFNNTFGAIFSIVLMGVVSICNNIILLKQSSVSQDDQETDEFWLLRLAFSLQSGWTISLFIMVINSLIAYVGAGVHSQIICGFLSVGVFIALSVKMLFANGRDPNFAIPSVFALFILGFALDNDKGNEVVQVYYGRNYYGAKYYGTKYYGTEVTQFSITSAIVASCIAIAVVVHGYNQRSNSKNMKNMKEADHHDYITADDEISNTSSEAVSYVAPRGDQSPSVTSRDEESNVWA